MSRFVFLFVLFSLIGSVWMGLVRNEEHLDLNTLDTETEDSKDTKSLDISSKDMNASVVCKKSNQIAFRSRSLVD